MDQENVLRAKQSELENSIFKLKQKEVCRVLSCFFLSIHERDGKVFHFPRLRSNFTKNIHDKK